jgi:hypothetical protein
LRKIPQYCAKSRNTSTYKWDFSINAPAIATIGTLGVVLCYFDIKEITYTKLAGFFLLLVAACALLMKYKEV